MLDPECIKLSVTGELMIWKPSLVCMLDELMLLHISGE